MIVACWWLLVWSDEVIVPQSVRDQSIASNGISYGIYVTHDGDGATPSKSNGVDDLWSRQSRRGSIEWLRDKDPIVVEAVYVRTLPRRTHAPELISMSLAKIKLFYKHPRYRGCCKVCRIR